MTFPDLPLLAGLVIGVAFLAAGIVKGTIGAGLPLVAIPIVAQVVEPALAVSLTIVPVIATNIWQALQGGHYREVVRRLWPYLVCMALGSVGGAQILATADPRLTQIVLGILVVAISTIQLVGGGFEVPQRTQPWLNPPAGLVCGAFGGIAGMMAPAILYSAALRLSKDMLISLMALVALTGTTPLYLTLFVNGVLHWPEMALSALTMLPVAIGMIAGKGIRDRISQRMFERVLFIGLIAIGLNLLRRGLM